VGAAVQCNVKDDHERSGRAACGITILSLMIHFDVPSFARGVTDPLVGSGALLGFLFSIQIAP
jgi:hypothetical protein